MKGQPNIRVRVTTNIHRNEMQSVHRMGQISRLGFGKLFELRLEIDLDGLFRNSRLFHLSGHNLKKLFDNAWCVTHDLG